jgi:micrococcal nuclease
VNDRRHRRGAKRSFDEALTISLETGPTKRTGRLMRRPRRTNRKLPAGWDAYADKRRSPKLASVPAWKYGLSGLILGGLAAVPILFWPQAGAADPAGPAEPVVATQIERSFTLCPEGGGTNCVVDGDTLWLDRVKIRVADIDTPETHPPRCASEAALGARATQRLLSLVNAGPFEVRSVGDRDADQYGRKLRVLLRDGQSLGDILVREGLARTWTGRREPWC